MANVSRSLFRYRVILLVLFVAGLKNSAGAASQTPAAESNAPPVAAVESQTATVPPLPAIERDPFWPVDFDPNPPVEVAPVAGNVSDRAVRPPPPPKLPEPTTEDWSTARGQLKANVGRSVNPDGSEQFFAFMHNRLVTVGQIVKAETPLFSFTWRIARIDAAGILFLPVEAQRLSDKESFAPPKTEE